MKEAEVLNSKLMGIEYTISLLKKEKKALEKKLEAFLPDRELYQKRYEENYDKFTKGVSLKELPNKELEGLGNSLTIDEIGRLGEQSYYEYLIEILDLDFCEVTWMNEKIESNKSFDFLVKIGKATFYVDVKTTRGNQDNKLYLSKSEIRFAKFRKPNYFVARLSMWDELNRYRAGHFNVKMLHIDKALELTK